MRVISSLRLGLLLLAASPMPVTAAADDTPLSSRQMRAQSESAANRRARRDLLSILKGPGKIRKGNRVMVGTVWFATPSYGTKFPGLCRTDSLFLNYAPRDGGRTEDEPVQPYGVESVPFYRVVGTVRSRNYDRAPAETVWQPACAELGDGGWFRAPEDDAAYTGVKLLEAAADGIKAGTRASINCAGAELPKGKDCKQTLLATLSVKNLINVSPCDAIAGRCLKYELDDWSVTIHVTGGGDDRLPNVEKVELAGPMIIVT